MADGPLRPNPRILIVDDHPVIRQGFAQAIACQVDLEVCGEAANVAEALRQVDQQQPDVVIVDISLDGEDGMELIDYVQSRRPSARILVCSARDEHTFAARVLRAGAMGYISKREALPKIVEAIRQVLRGEIYLSPSMAASLLQSAAAGQPSEQDPVETLSNRELQIFQMIGEGLNMTQIANRLSVSPKTIESHRKLIKAKLKLLTGAELSRRAFMWVQQHS